ncbi:MAG: hypothetical protein AB7N65_16240 [Vicinamibacterales bacterium]
MHRAQFSLGQGSRTHADTDALEREARIGAHAIVGGRPFSARLGAAPTARLYFSGTAPMASTLEGHGQREMQALETVRPGPNDVSTSITANESENATTRVADYHYEFDASAKGTRGSIHSRTLLDIHYDPNDPRGWVSPTSELKIVQPPEFWKFYPITISYQRTIHYADDYGRVLDVLVNGKALLDYPQWEVVLRRHPQLSSLTLADIAAIEAETVYLSTTIVGKGNLTTIVERDFPSMPADIKAEMLKDAPLLSYSGSASAFQEGSGSLRSMSVIASMALSQPDGPLGASRSTKPGMFVHLELNAGQQYDAIRAYLEGYDALAVARLQEELAERLQHPSSIGPASDADAGDGLLDDILDWIADLWNSLPAWLRGTLKAIGKAALVIGIVLVAAALIVFLAPVELTVAGVALAIGAVLLAAGFLYSIVQRSLESYATGVGNPLTVFLAALGDTIGISGIYEGITNESILTGQPLNLDEEEQYERGVGGLLQLLMLVFGLRSARRGRSAPATDKAPSTGSGGAPGRVTTRVPGLYEQAVDPNVAPPGGWTFSDTTTRVGTRLTVETTVTAPDGTTGSMGRSFDTTTGQLSMDFAFLDQIPAAMRWVDTAPQMVAGRGTPLETYMTLRQMRLMEAEMGVGVGAAFAGPRTVHLSTIINTRTCLQLAAREMALGRAMTQAELDVAILDTHSVQYANNSIVQTGGRIVGARVSPSGRMRAGDIASTSDLAAHGVSENTQVRYGFDIDLTVEPAP